MRKDDKKKLIWGIIVVAAIVGIYFAIMESSAPGKLYAFAECLKDKDAVFYGAFWCPHCQNQKALFGKSAKFLPYVECSSPDGRSQLKICQDKKIDGYPTWIFADGERKSGEIALEELAEKTGCRLPQ